MTLQQSRSRRLVVGLALDVVGVVLLVAAAAVVDDGQVDVGLLLAVPSVLCALAGAIATGKVILEVQAEAQQRWRLAVAVPVVVVLIVSVIPIGTVVLGSAAHFTPP